jgi:hypothetical protein
MLRAPRSPIVVEDKGDPVTDERNNESPMDETGLGLLPGVALALGLIVGAMALLLTGSMWAVFGLLALAMVVTAAMLAVVIALVDEEGEPGRRLRRAVPGLGDRAPN